MVRFKKKNYFLKLIDIQNRQYRTIIRGRTSLLAGLKKEFPNINIEDYITFNSLRNHGNILGIPVTEQIYVHSKIMIVDDRGKSIYLQIKLNR
jgi:phospholipase D1/2